MCPTLGQYVHFRQKSPGTRKAERPLPRAPITHLLNSPFVRRVPPPALPDGVTNGAASMGDTWPPVDLIWFRLASPYLKH